MRCKGFTLIEAMIVVAIIGILAAVLIPVLTGQGRATSSEGREIGAFREPVREYCHDGIVYLAVGRGISPKLDKLGRPVTCN